MPRLFVSIGSNIERESNIRGAVAALRHTYGKLILSRIYETAPQGFSGANFYNLVAAFDTDDTIDAVSERLAAIERAHGRSGGEPQLASRTLDIDLLLYGDRIIHRDGLDIPRADIAQYAFVLAPLAEIAPNRKHPETGETFRAMWDGFPSPAIIRTVSLPLDAGADPAREK